MQMTRLSQNSSIAYFLLLLGAIFSIKFEQINNLMGSTVVLPDIFALSIFLLFIVKFFFIRRSTAFFVFLLSNLFLVVFYSLYSFALTGIFSFYNLRFPVYAMSAFVFSSIASRDVDYIKLFLRIVFVFLCLVLLHRFSSGVLVQKGFGYFSHGIFILAFASSLFLKTAESRLQFSLVSLMLIILVFLEGYRASMFILFSIYAAYLLKGRSVLPAFYGLGALICLSVIYSFFDVDLVPHLKFLTINFLENGTVQARIEAQALLIREILNAPFVGQGLIGDKIFFDLNVLNSQGKYVYIGSPHNAPLQLVYHFGAVGFFIIMGPFFAYAIKALICSSRVPNNSVENNNYVIGISFVAFFLSSLTSPLGWDFYASFYLFAFLLFSMENV